MAVLSIKFTTAAAASWPTYLLTLPQPYLLLRLLPRWGLLERLRSLSRSFSRSRSLSLSLSLSRSFSLSLSLSLSRGSLSLLLPPRCGRLPALAASRLLAGGSAQQASRCSESKAS